jgi:hypothetical protein
MASPASIHRSPRRRWSASSRSRSARGLHSAGREAALPSAPDEAGPDRLPAGVPNPRSIEAQFYFPKNLGLKSRTDAMVAPIHWPGVELDENIPPGVFFAGRQLLAGSAWLSPPLMIDFIGLF